MRFGSDDNWVCLERVGSPHPPSVFRFTALATGAGWKFAVTGEQILVYRSNEIVDSIADFTALRIHQVELALSDGGWLLIKRPPKGFILVRYRVTRRGVGASLQGRIVLEDEAAKSFCDELSIFLS